MLKKYGIKSAMKSALNDEITPIISLSVAPSGIYIRISLWPNADTKKTPETANVLFSGLSGRYFVLRRG